MRSSACSIMQPQNFEASVKTRRWTRSGWLEQGGVLKPSKTQLRQKLTKVAASCVGSAGSQLTLASYAVCVGEQDIAPDVARRTTGRRTDRCAPDLHRLRIHDKHLTRAVRMDRERCKLSLHGDASSLPLLSNFPLPCGRQLCAGCPYAVMLRACRC